jgi:hypothetical protein
MTYGQDTSTTSLSTSDEFDTVDDSEILALDLDSIIAHHHTGTHVKSSWSIEDIEEATVVLCVTIAQWLQFEHLFVTVALHIMSMVNAGRN